MRVKLLTFRYSATLGGFDDTALTDFTRDKEVIAFREHFYVVNEVPHLSCVVPYQDAVVPQAALAAAREIAPRPQQTQAPRLQRRDGAPDPCEGMSESERALFNHLREWRAKQCREDGVPPYLLLTNRQLVEIVRRRPDSPTALGHIDGIGPGKVERYGAAILRCLLGSMPSAGLAATAPEVARPEASRPKAMAAPADPLAAEAAP